MGTFIGCAALLVEGIVGIYLMDEEFKSWIAGLWENGIRVIEQPLVTTAIGIFAGLVGLFLFTPVLFLCGILFMGGLHRSRVLTGRNLRLQIPVYILVLCSSSALSIWLGGILRKELHIPTAVEIGDYVVRHLPYRAEHAEGSGGLVARRPGKEIDPKHIAVSASRKEPFGPSPYPLSPDIAKSFEPHEKYFSRFFNMHDSELKKYVSDTIVTLNAFEAGWVGHEKPEISSNSDPKSSEESARDAAHFNAELEIRNEEQRRYDRDYAVQFQKQFPFLPELQQELARRCNNRHVSTNDVTSPDYSIDRRKNSADKWAGYLYEMTRCLND